MTVKKGLKIIGRIDEKTLAISTNSYPLRRIVKDRIENGLVILWKAKHIEKTKTYVDIPKKLFPKDGKNFWEALSEELELEGYTIS